MTFVNMLRVLCCCRIQRFSSALYLSASLPIWLLPHLAAVPMLRNRPVSIAATRMPMMPFRMYLLDAEVPRTRFLDFASSSTRLFRMLEKDRRLSIVSCMRFPISRMSRMASSLF